MMTQTLTPSWNRAKQKVRDFHRWHWPTWTSNWKRLGSTSVVCSSTRQVRVRVLSSIVWYVSTNFHTLAMARDYWQLLQMGNYDFPSMFKSCQYYCTERKRLAKRRWEQIDCYEECAFDSVSLWHWFYLPQWRTGQPVKSQMNIGDRPRWPSIIELQCTATAKNGSILSSGSTTEHPQLLMSMACAKQTDSMFVLPWNSFSVWVKKLQESTKIVYPSHYSLSATSKIIGSTVQSLGK